MARARIVRSVLLHPLRLRHLHPQAAHRTTRRRRLNDPFVNASLDRSSRPKKLITLNWHANRSRIQLSMSSHPHFFPFHWLIFLVCPRRISSIISHWTYFDVLDPFNKVADWSFWSFLSKFDGSSSEYERVRDMLPFYVRRLILCGSNFIFIILRVKHDNLLLP